jgi:hypothetical protein
MNYYVLILNAETKEITGLDLSGVELTKDLDEYLIEDLGLSLENSIYMRTEQEPELSWLESTSVMVEEKFTFKSIDLEANNDDLNKEITH